MIDQWSGLLDCPSVETHCYLVSPVNTRRAWMTTGHKEDVNVNDIDHKRDKDVKDHEQDNKDVEQHSYEAAQVTWSSKWEYRKWTV